MTICYLNGEFIPLEHARISPMDRGFLFGDGVYEVIPSYEGKLVGAIPHLERLERGLSALSIETDYPQDRWSQLLADLVQKNQDLGENLGIYLQISRGADTKRFHAYPEGVSPTIFAFVEKIPAAPVADKNAVKTYKVSTELDLRWHRCNIKTTALLGNVMHFQQGHAKGCGEVILYNDRHEMTEGAAVNCFIVKDGVVITPPLDEQILPGITRHMLIDILKTHSDIPVQERSVTMDEVREADEVWLTSSRKEIAPVSEIDGQSVGDGRPGDVWLAAQTLFCKHRYDYS